MEGTIQEYRQLFRDMRNYGATSCVILELRRLVPGVPFLNEVAVIQDAETVSFREFIDFVIRVNQELKVV